MKTKEEVQQLLKEARASLKDAESSLVKSKRGSVEWAVNRDLKTAFMAEINILLEVLNDNNPKTHHQSNGKAVSNGEGNAPGK